MSSEGTETDVDNVDVVVNTSPNGTNACKKKRHKVPKRVHKSEREKRKREQLNSHFLALANVLDEPKEGKASVLCETIRLLKDFFGRIEDLQKENAALLSECQYITTERNELQEENSALGSEIGQLRNELEAKLTESNPDLHNFPHEYHQLGAAAHFQSDCLGTSTVESALPGAPAVFVLSMPDPAQLTKNPMAPIIKPHARYASPADSWHVELLKEKPEGSQELQINETNLSSN